MPDGCIVDSAGNPTNDPRVFYGDPPGAILPFGGHKGYGLSVVTEILAGALTGGGCTKPGITRLEQGMLTIVIDPAVLQSDDVFRGEIRQFVDFVKASEKVAPDADIFTPGELEQRNRETRMAEGIDLDERTWQQLVEVAQSLKVTHDLLDGRDAG